MAFLDKLNQVAKNIGDRTNDAIESTKLNSKISAEQSAAIDEIRKIGEFYYNVFASGGEVAPEVMEFCQRAQQHYTAIRDAQAQIEQIRQQNEPAGAGNVQSEPAGAVMQQGIVCPSCGMGNPAGTKFCQNCGNSLVQQEPERKPQERFCPNCGSAVNREVRFCTECGQQL